jgi:hypothetical protein
VLWEAQPIWRLACEAALLDVGPRGGRAWLKLMAHHNETFCLDGKRSSPAKACRSALLLSNLSVAVDGPSRSVANASVSMGFNPPHSFVQRTITWLTEFCQLTINDLDLVSRMEIAVAELVENVVKYGMTANARVDVALEHRGSVVYLRIETRNAAPPEDIERAVELLTEIRDSKDPVAYYDQLILAVAPVRTKGVSGLGLARIRAEGELELDFRVDGNMLTICVETPIGAAETPKPC